MSHGATLLRKTINSSEDDFANKLHYASLQLHANSKMHPGESRKDLDFFFPLFIQIFHSLVLFFLLIKLPLWEQTLKGQC